MSRIVLLGPQRLRPVVGQALDDLDVAGPVALINAGWRDAEGEDEQVRAVTGREVRNLGLYASADRVYDADPELHAVLRRRQRRLKQLQRLYRRRLDCALAGYRELQAVVAEDGEDPALIDSERAAALDTVRDLDQHQLEAVAAIREAAERELPPLERESVVREREEIGERIADCVAVLVAGGHVATILNRLRLFDIAGLIGERPVIAWSAGAMALAERVVLFHDSPPWGEGNAEVLDRGLGLCPGVLPLPHARRRLRLDDPDRVELLIGRFAPLRCVGLDEGSILRGRGAYWGGEAVWSGADVALLDDKTSFVGGHGGAAEIDGDVAEAGR